jgi:hypothetical protein
MVKSAHDITIAADDHKSKSYVNKCLLEMPDAIFDFRCLLTCDYLAENRILCEQEKLDDFALSIISCGPFKRSIRLADL